MSHPDRVPKLCGADVELSNFFVGPDVTETTSRVAAKALLGRITGLPKERSFKSICNCANCQAQRQSRKTLWFGGSSESTSSEEVFDPQDIGRRFLLENGGCAYIDLDHLELCIPEVLSAVDHVAASHAMLRIARRAQADVARTLRPGTALQVLVNNSDGHGNSYGSHLNFLMSRRGWENIFHRKIQYMLHLAAFQVSSIVLTGQGKVGAENGTAQVDYQIAQRADFFETLTGLQTTFHRPIINGRDEALTGSRGYSSSRSSSFSYDGMSYRETSKPDVEDANEEARYARLHVIFYDNNLCHAASLFKVGLMQIMLAMIEAEQIDASLLLDDPVDAVIRYSHDPSLQVKARLGDGRDVTAVDLLRMFLDKMQKFVDRGECEGLVPQAAEILQLADETAGLLARGDFDAVAPRLDWVLKKQILDRARGRRPELSWESPEMKHLDHLYSSLDPAEGLYWAYERAGEVERVADDAEIERFVLGPPEGTRAYTRAMLLRLAAPDQVQDVDWDRMQFQLPGSNGKGRRYCSLDMHDPLGLTKADTGELFDHPEATLERVLESLGVNDGSRRHHEHRSSAVTADQVGGGLIVAQPKKKSWTS